MALPTVESVLIRESQLMGRPVKFRSGWEYAAANMALRIVISDVEDHEVGGFLVKQTRWTVVTNEGQWSGGVLMGELEAADGVS